VGRLPDALQHEQGPVSETRSITATTPAGQLPAAAPLGLAILLLTSP
jgi:hypothetical protein